MHFPIDCAAALATILNLNCLDAAQKEKNVNNN